MAAHGADDSGQGDATRQLLWKLANFAILAAGLGFLLRKKAGAFFRNRTDSIRKGIEEADRLHREAEARAAEVEGRLRNLEAEIESLRRGARAELAAESERIKLETGESVRKLQEQAEQEIASAAKAARRQVRAQAAQLAVDLAAGRIRDRLTLPADEALVTSFLKDLETGSRTRSGKELN